MNRTISYAISFIFHPLFILTYMVVLLTLMNPQLFGVNHISENGIFIIQVFLYTFLLPAFATFMMLQLGFIESLDMKDKQERIGPLIATTIFYLWLSYNYYKTDVAPLAFTVFMVGAAISLCIAFVINTVSKISLHAIGVGGLMGMIVISMMHYSYPAVNIGGHLINTNWILIFGILITGLVCSARLSLDAHEPMDLYGGLFIGFGTQFLALNILT